MAKNKNDSENTANGAGDSFSSQTNTAQPAPAQPDFASKRLGVGAIIGISAAGVVVLLGTAVAGGVAGAAIALNGAHDRPGIEQSAEGYGPGGERGDMHGDRDGMRGGFDDDRYDDDRYDDDRYDDDRYDDDQRGPGGQQQGGMKRDGMNQGDNPNMAPRPDATPDTNTGAS